MRIKKHDDGWVVYDPAGYDEERMEGPGHIGNIFWQEEDVLLFEPTGSLVSERELRQIVGWMSRIERYGGV